MHPFGLLLVGHGTLSAEGTRGFLTLADLVRERLAPVPVKAAFLELQEPTIAGGIARLANLGVKRLVVMPLLLFAAGHARRDIPQAVEQALSDLALPPEMALYAEHLGCHPAMLELSQRQMAKAAGSLPPASAGDTCLLLVGRGSHDESATAEMHEFARLRAKANRKQYATVRVAFIAMAKPSLTETLPEIAAAGYRCVIVQPHLLFEGEIVERLRTNVAQIAAQHPDQQWLVTSLLAEGIGTGGDADELLAQVVLDRLTAATSSGLDRAAGFA